MTDILEIQVDRGDIRSAQAVTRPAAALAENQLRVAVHKFALTANNVTYAVAGESIGYWNFYPAEGGLGIVPVWGIGEVMESAHPDVGVGERLYGFFPMASHAILTIGEPRPNTLTDVSPHRLDLPGTYNAYQRTAQEPEIMRAMEDQRCLLFPLFATSYLLYDYLVDNDLFGADTVIVGSASSKTAFGMAHLLHHDQDVAAELVGVTSPGNLAFVESLGIYDKVVCYGEEAGQLDAARKAAYVDMSGDSELTRRIHEHFGDRLTESCAVGATHWQSFGADTGELPGPQPQFFFAPAQIEKRNAEWGPGVVLQKAAAAFVDIARDVSEQVTIERIGEPDAVVSAWQDLVDGKVSPSRGLMASLL